MTLRKPGYICIRQRHFVRRDELELYDKGRPADCYKLSPLSYAIVANTFRMNIPIPEIFTWSEACHLMHIPIAGGTQSTRKNIVTSVAEPGPTYQQTQSPILQAPQDREVIDQASNTPNTLTQDRQKTEGSPITQDRLSPAKDERPDELVGIRSEESGLFALFMRAVRRSCTSGDRTKRALFYLGLSGSIANYPSWWPGDIGVLERESAALEAWEALRKKQR